MKKIRWGVLGAGLIAGKLAKAINEVDDAVLYAVGSRDVTKAKNFAEKFGAQKFFSSYEALCACEDVDVIYVATPHVFHKEHTLLALEKGKHVLCEKPFAVNSGEAEAMLATARRQQLFVMEAMWTCVMPGIKKLKTLIEGGVIGQPLSMEASFGFKEPFDENSRLYKRDLAGGALLDVGIYPLALASYLFGKPQSVTAQAELGRSGVDESSTYQLSFANGVKASLHSSINKEAANNAVIHGTDASLHLPEDWWLLEKITLLKDDIEEVIDTSYDCDVYVFEVKEVCDCLQNGLLQSSQVSHAWTKNMMSLLDAIRHEIGLVYPLETVGV